MGWLQDLKQYFFKKATGLSYADVMSGRTPIYSAFGRDIYASDVVTQAINCVIDEIKKLAPAHVIAKGMDIVPVGAGDDRQRVLNNPNHYMITSDFLAKVMYMRYAKYNAWVVPTYKVDKLGRRTYTGLYPVNPAGVTLMEDKTGRLFVALRFENEPEPWVLPYSDIIHLRRDYGADEYMGGGPGGVGDERALLTTLEINHQMLQGISKTMKSSQAINGIVKYGSIIGEAQTRKAAQEWEDKLRNNQSGILVMDMQSTYTNVPRDLKLVDAATLKFIDEKILRHFGVPLPILTGDFTKAQYEAFYQKTIEPLIIQLSQEFTRVLCPESDGRGHKIQFFAKELIFMSTEQKINMINLLAPTGGMFENEKRAAFGLHPLEELAGKRYQSLNWIDANMAAEYQANKSNTDPPPDDGQHDGGASNEE